MNTAYWLNTLYWITSRAAGITATVLASASVGVGLAMSGKLVNWGGSDRRNIHQALSLATMIAIAIHGLTLLGDSHFHASVFGVTVPLVLAYEPLPTSIGIIAGWGLIILGLSYYTRRWIGHRRWRLMHRFTALAWVGALVHTFAEGTDVVHRADIGHGRSRALALGDALQRAPPAQRGGSVGWVVSC